MIAFPNAKINIGLNVISKRPDGHHNLSSCFLPIGWKDALETVPSAHFELTSSGLPVPGRANLCAKAYALLKEKHGIPPVKMHLHKAIPIGAGLGGGSSDAAFALKLLNEQFGLGLSNARLEAYAKTLGADCPFFIGNRPKLVAGTGGIMEEIALGLHGYSILIVFPGIHVSTKTAFSGIAPREPKHEIKLMLKLPPSEWQGIITNDFEQTVFAAHPAIRAIKEKLIALGADYAAMTGTGSAVYGFFDRPADVVQLSGTFADCKVWAAQGIFEG